MQLPPASDSAEHTVLLWWHTQKEKNCEIPPTASPSASGLRRRIVSTFRCSFFFSFLFISRLLSGLLTSLRRVEMLNNISIHRRPDRSADGNLRECARHDSRLAVVAVLATGLAVACATARPAAAPDPLRSILRSHPGLHKVVASAPRFRFQAVLGLVEERPGGRPVLVQRGFRL